MWPATSVVRTRAERQLASYQTALVGAPTLKDRVRRIAELRSAARVICATNQLLPTLVAEQRFRADLLYRLQVLTITYNNMVHNGALLDDAAKADEVWANDEPIDGIYNGIFREMLTFMMEDPRNISFCAHLLFCAKNLERVGDHATNIAENVHFMVSGAALPVMAHAPQEVEEMASAASALVLNIGTLSDEWIEAMIAAMLLLTAAATASAPAPAAPRRSPAQAKSTA